MNADIFVSNILFELNICAILLPSHVGNSLEKRGNKYIADKKISNPIHEGPTYETKAARQKILLISVTFHFVPNLNSFSIEFLGQNYVCVPRETNNK